MQLQQGEEQKQEVKEKYFITTHSLGEGGFPKQKGQYPVVTLAYLPH